MFTKLSSILVAIITIVTMDCVTAHVAFAQWDRFRGENGNGAIDQCNVPLPWSEGDVAWRVNLPGKGNGSPIVVGDKVFIMSADPATAERYALAYSLKTGKELWRKSFASKEHKLHTRSSYASCTPCASSDSVYFAWATPESLIVKSFSHDGVEKWTKEMGRYISAHGFGASPILVDDKLILPNSQDAEELPQGVAPGDSSIIALNASNGNLAWETPRKSVRTSYGTPAVFTGEDGRKSLVFAETGDGFFALDVATGKPLWSKQVFTKRCVSCPVVVGNIVIGTEGSGGGGNALFAIDLKGNHDLVYEIKRSAPYVPTPVSKGDLLFLWSDNGIVSCVDAKNGEQKWSERIGGNVSTSPVIAGDKLIGIAEDGTVTVLSATAAFKKLGEVKLGETTRSTPLVSTSYILLRSDSKLICVGSPK